MVDIIEAKTVGPFDGATMVVELENMESVNHISKNLGVKYIFRYQTDVYFSKDNIVYWYRENDTT